MTGKNRVHFDSPKPGQLLRWGICGFSGETETDVTKVTCRSCRKRLAGGKGAAPERIRVRAEKKIDELALLLAPKAPPPPVLDAGTWGVCCAAEQSAGARHLTGPRPCGSCPLCEWERSANLWGSKEVAAHNDSKTHRVQKLPGGPRWPNVNRALIAYAEYHAHQRFSKSATAGILARIEFGSDTDGGAARPDDPQQRAADDMVAVEAALHVAYPEGAHTLSQEMRIKLLLARTPGVAPITVDDKGVQSPTELPTYEALSEYLGVGVDELKGLVNNGRGRAALDLFKRGMIPRPVEMRRDARGGRRSATMEQQPEASP